MKRQESFRNIPPLPLWIFLTALPLLATFFFSAQDAAHSGALSLRILRGLLRRFPVLSSLGSVTRLHYLLRKAAHFTLYCLLGCGLRGLFTYQKRVNAVYGALFAGNVCAVLDEFHQHFSAGRAPSLFDAGIDTCGVITGCLFVSLFFFLFRTRFLRAS